jgi:glutamate synthase domain-containing protein 2
MSVKVHIDYAIGSMVESWSRKRFYALSAIALVTIVALGFLWSKFAFVALFVIGPLIAMGITDARQTRHTILRNFPILGRIRYFMESLRPEIRQYFVESDSDDTPFSREKRSLVFQRAKGQVDTRPFGTLRDVNAIGYEWVNHSILPVHPSEEAKRFVIGGAHVKKPYSASLLNVSAMSFGALSRNAILALNQGAKMGGFAHNSGEGGISPYHLKPGGDLIWQIGTGYFGCRQADGKFDPGLFQEKCAANASIKMIELKLSQGAKPAHGGILPASKNTPEIAAIRHVQPGTQVNSPPAHSAFSNPHGLLKFIQEMRELSGGLPVGFKLCVGRPREWFAIVRAMYESGIYPDFITVDGGEGGTGAAPPEFSNSVGMPLGDGLSLVHGSLVGVGMRKDIRIIASGKVTNGFDILRLIALGADGCNSARAMMFALGCIQALKCNTNKCPTGVATTDPALEYGLVPEHKSERVRSFHEKTVKSFMEMLGAAGLSHPDELDAWHVVRRVDAGRVMSLAEIYPRFEPGCLLAGECPEVYREDWRRAVSRRF